MGYTKEKIKLQRELCKLESGLDIGDFAGLLKEALDEIEFLMHEVANLKQITLGLQYIVKLNKFDDKNADK